MAIEALKGQKKLAQLSERFNVSSVMGSNWRLEFPSNASAAFTEKKKDDAKDKELKQCYNKIGSIFTRLTMEGR